MLSARFLLQLTVTFSCVHTWLEEVRHLSWSCFFFLLLLLLLYFFFTSFSFYMYLFVLVCVCVCQHECAVVYVWKSDDELRESVLSCHHMGSRDPMQVCRLGSTQLSLQPCVTVPGASFIRVLTLSEVIFLTTQSLKAPPLSTITLASGLATYGFNGTYSISWFSDCLLNTGQLESYCQHVYNILKF